jgi:hypothetical protein
MRLAERRRSAGEAGTCRSLQGNGRDACTDPDSARNASSAAISKWSSGLEGARKEGGLIAKKKGAA